ncbi:MAG: aspartate ammonia-lyase, partial [Cyanobacteria bacterium]|nr:aspartate ammonia-lyase [Cyanobacteriota bacterium]
MTATRVEKDRFGERELPAAALYGIQTLRSLDNLSFSGKRLLEYPELVTSLALVKKACASTNVRTGDLAVHLGAAIEWACDRIAGGDFLEQFPVDMLHGGGSIAFNMNINEVIANMASMQLGGVIGEYSPVEPKAHVNMCQSTADACATSFRLAIRRLYDLCRPEIELLCECLSMKADQFDSVTTIARTCLQDAMPVSLGTLFRGYASALGRRLACLDRTA